MPKLKDPNVWFQNALKVTEDPAASGWLKNALLEAINRDPVDAAGDARADFLTQHHRLCCSLPTQRFGQTPRPTPQARGTSNGIVRLLRLA